MNIHIVEIQRVYVMKNAVPTDPESILLGPPGCAQVFPYLSPGPLDFLVV